MAALLGGAGAGAAGGAAGTAATGAAASAVPAAAQAAAVPAATSALQQAGTQGMLMGAVQSAGRPSINSAVNAVDQAASATQGWRGLLGNMIEGQTGTNPFTVDTTGGYGPALRGIVERYMQMNAQRPQASPFAPRSPDLSSMHGAPTINLNARRQLDLSQRYGQ